MDPNLGTDSASYFAYIIREFRTKFVGLFLATVQKLSGTLLCMLIRPYALLFSYFHVPLWLDSLNHLFYHLIVVCIF